MQHRPSDVRSDELLVGDRGVGPQNSEWPFPTESEMKIDVSKNRFPFSIVWGHLPCLTQIMPIVGHMGITDSQGRIHDFQGPYMIIEDQFMTGTIFKYWQVDPQKMNIVLQEGQSFAEAWDLAVRRGDREYSKHMHNICCDNCHSHCANVWKELYYPNDKDRIQMPYVPFLFMFMAKCRYVSWGKLICTWLPFFVILGLVLVWQLILK